ncbi:hypothetical protein CFAM422_002121 [Trichoderma lentiforme]|uniref:Uncharacterized protein n=1 Tax=Trichoderma lentiforme TaxID=1567552 RepID=A0A9P4XNJ4_9HYPO|nr:hypothetical protein CFAM422_002121 [Trichoderma lentiforme]
MCHGSNRFTQKVGVSGHSDSDCDQSDAGEGHEANRERRVGTAPRMPSLGISWHRMRRCSPVGWTARGYL